MRSIIIKRKCKGVGLNAKLIDINIDFENDHEIFANFAKRYRKQFLKNNFNDNATTSNKKKLQPRIIHR